MDSKKAANKGHHQIPLSDSQPKSPQHSEIEALARQFADDFDIFEDVSDEGVSLEEISQSYASQLPQASGDSQDSASQHRAPTSDASEDFRSFDSLPSDSQTSGQVLISPAAIIEAVLLVGRPDNQPITATQISSLMRGVSQDEVDKWIVEINRDYQVNHRAMQITSVGGGYQMQLADDLHSIRDRLLGPARPIRLSQAAIDCIALVSYQPGISRDQLDQQLGKSSGAVLNQLVRRQLLEMKRITVERKQVAHYYPTQRMLELVGLESLDDLPTAEEWSAPE